MEEKNQTTPSRGRSRWRLLLISGMFLALIIAGFLLAVKYYRFVYAPNVDLHGKDFAWLYIPTGSSYDGVKDSLFKHSYILNKRSFEWVAKRKDYQFRVLPGRYKLTRGMDNNTLINKLRGGHQDPVRVSFQSIRTTRDFAGKISHYLEADSISILNLISDPSYLEQFSVTPISFFSIVIPNTYEFYWNTSADKFIKRMYEESRKFWNKERIRKADSIGLSVNQVSTLASIIEKETAMDSEKARIAGVYMNRLKAGMPLQADPTVIFAINDYTIKRVLNMHTRYDSPYNTYLVKGLPPGPICIPSISSIDAVLNYEHHNYLYFCARADFSGYHSFSRDLAGHSINARKYQKALKAKGVH